MERSNYVDKIHEKRAEVKAKESDSKDKDCNRKSHQEAL